MNEINVSDMFEYFVSLSYFYFIETQTILMQLRSRSQFPLCEQVKTSSFREANFQVSKVVFKKI